VIPVAPSDHSNEKKTLSSLKDYENTLKGQRIKLNDERANETSKLKITMNSFRAEENSNIERHGTDILGSLKQSPPQKDNLPIDIQDNDSLN